MAQHSGGDPADPTGAEDHSDHDDADAVVDDTSDALGGTDWLLQQLSGGRTQDHTPAQCAPAQRAPESEVPEPTMPEPTGAADVLARPPIAPEPSVVAEAPLTPEAPIAPDLPRSADAPPKLRWSWATESVEPINPVDPIEPAAPTERVVPAAQTAPTVPIVPAVPSVPAVPEVPSVPTQSIARAQPDVPPESVANASDTGPATFLWGLTPNDQVDPLIHPQATEPVAPETAPSQVDPAVSTPAVSTPAMPTPAMPTAALPTAALPTTALPTTDAPLQEASTDAFFTSAATGSPAGLAPVGPAAVAHAPVAHAPVAPAPRAIPAAVATRSPIADARRGAGGPRGPRDASARRSTRVLFWVAGALLVVLLLIGLFVLGTRLPTLFQGAPTPTPTATKTATPTPTPTPTVVATGPQSPGTHAWDSLRGGECLQPFTTPWALTFTVVDCATPHAAQLVYTGVFSTDAAAAYPGVDQLASQINLLCSRPGILNLTAAAAFTDAQIQAAYPATAEQWQGGQRSYFCFVNRAGGEPLTGSIAGPGPS